MPKKKTISDEEKTRLVQLIDKYREEKGLSIAQACKEADWHPSNYAWWKAVLEKRPYKRKSPSEKLAQELASGRDHFQVPVRAVDDSASPSSWKDSPPKKENGQIKITVKEYTFEGTNEQVMAALTRFKETE